MVHLVICTVCYGVCYGVFVNETFENALKTNNTEESLQDNIQDVLENNQVKDIIEELDDNAFAIFDFIVKTSHND